MSNSSGDWSAQTHDRLTNWLTLGPSRPIRPGRPGLPWIPWNHIHTNKQDKSWFQSGVYHAEIIIIRVLSLVWGGLSALSEGLYISRDLDQTWGCDREGDWQTAQCSISSKASVTGQFWWRRNQVRDPLSRTKSKWLGVCAFHFIVVVFDLYIFTLRSVDSPWILSLQTDQGCQKIPKTHEHHMFPWTSCFISHLNINGKISFVLFV